MEYRNELKKLAVVGDERFARVETYLSKLEQKADDGGDRLSRLEKSMEEMQAMLTDFMSTSRRSRAAKTRSNCYDGVEELPVFDGVDPIGWIIRANLYFETHPTPEEDKVQCGLVCIERLVPRWVDWVSQNRPDLSWVQLCGMLVERYDGRFKGDLIERICSLKHTGDIEEFIGDFVRIVIELRGLPDSHCVGFFLHGLRPEVRTELRIRHPKKLQEAIAVARDIEEELMQPDTKDGYESYKFRGHIKNEEVIVLISMGSNKSCVSSSVARRLNLKRSDASRYKGQDIFGNIVSTKGVCRGARISMGGCSFNVDLFMFDLAFADVILGRDWLRQLGGSAIMDYVESAISFEWEGAQHRLRSERVVTKVAECGSFTLLKEENGKYVVV